MGSVYFSAPLYRKNLHYKVIPKQQDGAKVLEAMTDYILTNHKGDSGIVYCLSRKVSHLVSKSSITSLIEASQDAEKVAEGIQKRSEGAIRTGVYHANKDDSEKEGLQRLWREGRVQVVCAVCMYLPVSHSMRLTSV